MMGFGEEAGVIPRFCRDLFSRLASMENEEVKCHITKLFLVIMLILICLYFSKTVCVEKLYSLHSYSRRTFSD